MLTAARNWLRRRVRERRWRHTVPILPPHVQCSGEEICVLENDKVPVSATARQALLLSDGQRRLSDVVRQSNVDPHELLALHDRGLLVLWKSPLTTAAAHPIESVVLSPHPDDAALSLGATLSDRVGCGGGVQITTVFSDTAWWRFPEGRDARTITAVRTAEEMFVARLLRAKLDLMGLPEAVLRGRTFEEVFTSPVDRRDAEVQDRLRAALASSTAKMPEVKRWYLPLGVGNHLDHRIVRDIGHETLTGAGVDPRRIAFYEEMPYALQWKPPAGIPAHLNGLRAHVQAKGGGGWKWKRELLCVYWTQLVGSQIREVVASTRLNGERVWSRR